MTVTFLAHLSKVGVNSIAYRTALLDKRKYCKPEIALNDTSCKIHETVGGANISFALLTIIDFYLLKFQDSTFLRTLCFVTIEFF